MLVTCADLQSPAVGGRRDQMLPNSPTHAVTRRYSSEGPPRTRTSLATL